jgi:hypothetical protein
MTEKRKIRRTLSAFCFAFSSCDKFLSRLVYRSKFCFLRRRSITICFLRRRSITCGKVDLGNGMHVTRDCDFCVYCVTVNTNAVVRAGIWVLYTRILISEISELGAFTLIPINGSIKTRSQLDHHI